MTKNTYINDWGNTVHPPVVVGGDKKLESKYKKDHKKKVKDYKKAVKQGKVDIEESIVSKINHGNLAEAVDEFNVIMAEKSLHFLGEQKKIIAARYGLGEGILDRFRKKQVAKPTRMKELDTPSAHKRRETESEARMRARSAKIKAGTYMMEKRQTPEERGAERDARRAVRSKLPLEIASKSELDQMAKDRRVKPTGSFTGRFDGILDKIRNG